MNKKSFTMVELLITMAISIVVFLAIGLLGISGMKTWSANTKKAVQVASDRNALTRMSEHIAASSATLVNTRQCDLIPTGPLKPTCKAGTSVISLKSVIADGSPIAGSIYTGDGKLKMGAAGKQYCHYRYMIDSSDQLVKSLECDASSHYCGDSACDTDEYPLNTTPGAGQSVVCAYDCGTCGNADCEAGETPTNCGADCSP